MKWLPSLSRRSRERGAPGAPRIFRAPATPVALAYVVLAALWILLSDWAASLLVAPEHLPEVQTIKGWLFVGVTGVLLWIVLHGYWRVGLRSQERQARSEQRLQAALDSLQATFLQLRAREPYEIVSVSEGITSIAEYQPEELLGEAPRTALELVHPDDRRQVFTAVRVAAQDGRGFVFEFRVLTRSGASRWVWCKGRSLPDGEVVELFLTDISRLKQLEAQLVQAHGIEALAELAAGVAHDVNNLLTVVLGHAELVEHRLRDCGESGASLLGGLDEVKSAARRAHGLNQRLMRLGWPERGERQELDLRELVEGTAELLRPMLRRRVTLTCECSAGPVTVKGNPRQLERVLLNLAVNARDAMPEGGRLTLTAAVVEHAAQAGPRGSQLPAGRYGCLTISDTGTGIPEEHVGRIFEPFFTTKGPDAGTGLGLAVVAGLVEQNGGRMLLESTPGEGTTFRIFLPLVSDGGEEPRDGTEEQSKARFASPVWSWGS